MYTSATAWSGCFSSPPAAAGTPWILHVGARLEGLLPPPPGDVGHDHRSAGGRQGLDHHRRSRPTRLVADERVPVDVGYGHHLAARTDSGDGRPDRRVGGPAGAGTVTLHDEVEVDGAC